MPARIDIDREAALLNVRLWVAERGWSLHQCADALGVNVNTLRTWVNNAGLRYEVRAAVLVPEEDR